MNNIQKAIVFFTFLLGTYMMHADNEKKRKFIDCQTIALSQLLKNISDETSALFYLVDNSGNPIVLQNLTSAIGGKSVQVPNLKTLNDAQKNLLKTLQVTVSENASPWVTQYLNNVKTYRSQGLSGDALNAWTTQWNTLASSYSSSLVKIFRTISISTSDAQTLGFMTKDNKPITFLFFDDPFPAHTVLGKKMKDLLNDFIKRYKKN